MAHEWKVGDRFTLEFERLTDSMMFYGIWNYILSCMYPKKNSLAASHPSATPMIAPNSFAASRYSCWPSCHVVQARNASNRLS